MNSLAVFSTCVRKLIDLEKVSNAPIPPKCPCARYIIQTSVALVQINSIGLCFLLCVVNT